MFLIFTIYLGDVKVVTIVESARIVQDVVIVKAVALAVYVIRLAQL